MKLSKKNQREVILYQNRLSGNSLVLDTEFSFQDNGTGTKTRQAWNISGTVIDPSFNELVKFDIVLKDAPISKRGARDLPSLLRSKDLVETTVLSTEEAMDFINDIVVGFEVETVIGHSIAVDVSAVRHTAQAKGIDFNLDHLNVVDTQNILRILQEESDFVKALYKEMGLLTKNGNPSETLEDLTRAIRRDNNYVQPHLAKYDVQLTIEALEAMMTGYLI